MRHQRHDGFSLVEMLAATVILGVLITVVLAPLTQLFKSSGKNGRTLQTTTQTQQITEYVRGQWQSYPVIMVPDPADASQQIDQNLAARSDSLARYDKTCSAPLPLTNGVTTTVVVKALDRKADETAPLTFSENCSATAAPTASNPPPPMKRLTVTTVTTAGDRSSLTLDIPRP